MALCAMLVATALTQASPCLSQGTGHSSVIVDLSVIDEAASFRRILPDDGAYAGDLRRPGPLHDAGLPPPLPPAEAASPPVRAPSAPAPGTAAFYALFPPPPPVPADVTSGEAPGAAEGARASAGKPFPAAALAALPIAKPLRPMHTRLAQPTPPRPAIHAASMSAAPAAVRPARRAALDATIRAIRPELAPAPKPWRRPENDERRPVRLRLPYAVAQTELSFSAQAQLEALVAEVRSNDRLRLRLAAYANAGAGSPGKARRTSLARALAVRAFLIECGIKASRIDLRALGNTAGAAEADRVDVVINDK